MERIGSQQHVTGSAAAADVRDYIVSTLTGFGLQPQIQDTISATGQLSGPYGMARVRNVVAVLPGTDSTGRVVMFAHYDSVQVSYGGNDDGAGVSTLLETARVLAAGPRPRNDIVFLFTDAEEACLCGAQAFVDQSPLAAQGGVAMNFESRGSSGPVVLFETSRGNANVVGVYADAVPYPVATSFAVEIYRILPNDTDFTPFRDSGRFSGLNSAYIDGSAVYHAPEDRPSYMDQASLQQHGDNAVALARSFGAADIAALTVPAANDSTYFPVLSVLLRYPGWLVWPLAILALLAVVGLAFLARRRGLTSWPRSAAGLGLAVVPLILAPVAAQLLWALLVRVATRVREHDRPVVAGLVPGVRGRAGADDRAHLVRAAAPADRCLVARDRRVRAAGRARSGAGRGDARRVVPGVAARAGRRDGVDRGGVGAAASGCGSSCWGWRPRSLSSSSRRPSRCSSRRSAWRPGAAGAFFAVLLGIGAAAGVRAGLSHSRGHRECLRRRVSRAVPGPGRHVIGCGRRFRR